MVPFSVTFVFRILNFIVLIGLAVYIFFRYFYASIKAHMITKQAALDHLEAQKSLLARRQKELDDQMHEQEIVYERLRAKLIEWRARVHQRDVEKKQEIETRKQQLFDRMHVRRKNIMIEQLQERVIPLAYEQARAQLQQKFSSSTQSNNYLENIIKGMK